MTIVGYPTPPLSDSSEGRRQPKLGRIGPLSLSLSLCVFVFLSISQSVSIRIYNAADGWVHERDFLPSHHNHYSHRSHHSQQNNKHKAELPETTPPLQPPPPQPQQPQQPPACFLPTLFLPSALLLSSVLAGPLSIRDNDSHDRICTNLNVQGGGCIRCTFTHPSARCIDESELTLPSLPDTKGFDVTGVVTEVDLTFPQVQSACDCIQECLNRPTTCSSYVYKFSTPESIQSGHRTCTLYSQFNLPADVAIEIDLDNTNNTNINAAEITMMGNNPQKGSVVPQAFKDLNNTMGDDDAFSGYVRQSHGKSVNSDANFFFLTDRSGSLRMDMLSARRHLSAWLAFGHCM